MYQNMLTFENMAQLDQACWDYRRLTGAWPTNVDMLRAVFPQTKSNLFLDGWSRKFVMVTSTNAPAVMRLVSYGKDGAPGGTGEDADIEQILE